MAYFAVLLFAGAVLTVLFWIGVAAAALIVLDAVLLVFKAVWWILTRPIVWFIVRPMQFVFGNGASAPTARTALVPDRAANALGPGICPPNPPITMGEKVDQLATITALLKTGAVILEEFDRLKAEILAS